MSKFHTYLIILIVIVFLVPKQNFAQLGEFGVGSINYGTRNFIEISYGIGELNHNNVTAPFNNLALNEVKLGRRSLESVANYKLIKFSDNYLFSSFIDDNLQSVNNTSKISYEIWRFGLGYRKGYGYNIGSFAIFPFYQMGLVWSKTNDDWTVF